MDTLGDFVPMLVAQIFHIRFPTQLRARLNSDISGGEVSKMFREDRQVLELRDRLERELKTYGAVGEELAKFRLD